jgi:hypothetical protein
MRLRAPKKLFSAHRIGDNEVCVAQFRPLIGA